MCPYDVGFVPATLQLERNTMYHNVRLNAFTCSTLTQNYVMATVDDEDRGDTDRHGIRNAESWFIMMMVMMTVVMRL